LQIKVTEDHGTKEGLEERQKEKPMVPNQIIALPMLVPFHFYLNIPS
jgi:hypothetical protein